jgi:hypothetical protein
VNQQLFWLLKTKLMEIHPNLQKLLDKLEKIKELTQLHTDTGKELHELINSVSEDLDRFAGTQEEQQPEEAPVMAGCSHPHWSEGAPGTMLTLKICSTCGVEKYD